LITLMYHGILSKDHIRPPDREVGAELYDVSIENFREQMQWLKDSDKKAILTFDDGEMNNYRCVLPIIKEFGFTAYFFIIVKRIGKDGYMGWKELKILSQEEMTIGSHGLSHEILTNLKDSQLLEELKASKHCLESNLGIPINAFSVPRGFYNDKIIQMAYEQGYTNIFISERLKGSKSVCTPRVAVKAYWSLKRFQQALENRIPISEMIGNFFKNTAKLVFRESGYNFLRRIAIGIIK